MNHTFKLGGEVSSPADDLLLGVGRTLELTPPPNPHENNIRSLLTLGTNESDTVKMRSMAVKRFEGVELNGLSYPLVSSSNVRDTLAEMLYIGDMKFVSVISKELLRRIQHYNLNFDIIVSSTESCKITNINICPNNIVDNTNNNRTTGNLIVVVVKVGICPAVTSLEPCKILSYKDYIYYERVGIRSKYIFDGVYYEDIPVDNITMNHMVLNTPKTVNKGSPLTVDGVVVGLYAYSTMDNAYYVRLSAIMDWLNHFTEGATTKTREADSSSNTQPAKVEYTPEQMYSILYDLSNRVMSLENQLKDMMGSRK